MFLLTAVASDSEAHDAGFAFLTFHLNETGALLLTILIALWVVSVFRIAWHLDILRHVASKLPESAVVILIGCVLGGVLVGLGDSDVAALTFDNDIFFLVLIPPIILEAGYFLDKPSFLANFWMILTHAFAGTILNAMTMGFMLWLVSPMFVEDFPILVAFTYGALISAVDPVAVIAIFEQVHVNSTLNILVFGESVLNDAVSIVLYRFFLGLIPLFEGPQVTAVDPGLAFIAIAQFLVVSLGGTLVGFVMAVIGSYVSKFCDHLVLLIPLLVLVHAFLAYVLAEMLSLSGIMAILFCGMIMSRYVPRNASANANITVKFVLKLFASTTETLIFLYLGVSTIIHLFGQEATVSVWDGAMIVFTILFMLPLRFVTVFSFNALHNRHRIIKVEARDSFIMAYGGLRGAIAFALAYTLPDTLTAKPAIITTTLVVIWFTIFVMGATLQPILKMLEVRLMDKHDKSMVERLLEKLSGELVDGVHLVTGHTASHVPLWLERTIHFWDSHLVHGEYVQEKELLEAIKQGDHRRHTVLRADVREGRRNTITKQQGALPPRLQPQNHKRDSSFQTWMLNQARERPSGPNLRQSAGNDEVEMEAVSPPSGMASPRLQIFLGGRSTTDLTPHRSGGLSPETQKSRSPRRHSHPINGPPHVRSQLSDCSSEEDARPQAEKAWWRDEAEGDTVEMLDEFAEEEEEAEAEAPPAFVMKLGGMDIKRLMHSASSSKDTSKDK